MTANRTLKATVTALALTTGLTTAAMLPAAPAEAGGSLSISIAPGSSEAAEAMRLGLGIYALTQGARNGHISQNGTGNSAGVAQAGGGNVGIVHQDGHGHNGTVTQNGNGNAYGLFQFGRGTSGHVNQSGNGNAGMTFQFGW